MFKLIHLMNQVASWWKSQPKMRRIQCFRLSWKWQWYLENFYELLSKKNKKMWECHDPCVPSLLSVPWNDYSFHFFLDTKTNFRPRELYRKHHKSQGRNNFVVETFGFMKVVSQKKIKKICFVNVGSTSHFITEKKFLKKSTAKWRFKHGNRSVSEYLLKSRLIYSPSREIRQTW